MSGEELRRAHFDLPARVDLRDFRPVPALCELQGVAPLVIVPGLRVFAAILERLAQRETQMVSIDRLRRGRNLLASRTDDLLLREVVRLEIGKAPVCVAEAWREHGSGAVALDRLLPTADRLQ